MADTANSEVVLVQDLVNLRTAKGSALTYEEMDYNIRTIARFLDTYSGGNMYALQTLLDELEIDVELASNNFANFVQSVEDGNANLSLTISDLEDRVANTIVSLGSAKQEVLDIANTEIGAARQYAEEQLAAALSSYSVAQTALTIAASDAVDVISVGVDDRVSDAVANATSQLASDIEDAKSFANTIVGEAKEALTTAISDAEKTLQEAIANSSAEVLSTVGDSYVLQTELETAITTLNEARASDLSKLEARVANNISSSITNLSTVVANTTDGLAQTITELDASLTDTVNSQIEATITYVDTAIRTVNSSLVSRVSELASSVNNTINARVGDLLLTLTDANTALATAIETLEATLSEGYATKEEVGTVEVNLENAIATSASTLSASFDEDINAVSTSLSTLETAFVEANSALSQRLDTLEVDVTNNISSSVTTLEKAIANTDAALATTASQLSASLKDIQESVAQYQYIFTDDLSASEGSSVDIDTGLYNTSGVPGYIVVTQQEPVINKTGTTNGAYVEIPADKALAYAERRIKIEVYARAYYDTQEGVSTNYAPKFTVVYSTNDGAQQDNLHTFDIVDDGLWKWYSFYYDVPAADLGGSDYIGIFGDVDNLGYPVDISRFRISVVPDIADVKDLNATIDTINQTIVDANSALALRITTLETDISNTISSRISTVESAISDTNNSLAQRITNLDSSFSNALAEEVSTINASINSISTTLTSVNSALSEQITTLSATVSNNITSSISTLEQALSDTNSALASRITTLDATFANNLSSAVDTLEQAVADANSALASRITTLDATFANNLSSAVDTLEQALSDANSSLATRITTLDTTFANNLSSAVSTLEQALADANTTLATRITNLDAAFTNNLSSAVSTLEQALADANSALATRITNLDSSLSNTISSQIETVNQTIANTELTLSLALQGLESNFSNNLSSEITTLYLTLSNTDSTIAQSISTLESTFSNNLIETANTFNSKIVNLQETFANADIAIAESITTLESTLSNNINSSVTTLELAISNVNSSFAQALVDLEATTANTYATISALEQVESDANSALVTAIDTLSTTVANNISSAITTLDQALSNSIVAVANSVTTLSTNVANTYATKTALTNAISGEQEARLEDIELLSVSLGSGTRRLNLNPYMSLGYTYWSEASTSYDDPTDNAQYGLIGDTSYSSFTGDNALYITGQGTLYYRHKLPVLLNRRYRVRIRVKNIGANNNRIYAGVATYDKDGDLETSGAGTHRYVAASSVLVPNDNEWHVYEGTITGGGANTNQFRTSTTHAAPMMIVGYQQNSTYKMLVDELSFTDITDLDQSVEAEILTLSNAVVTAAQSSAEALSSLATTFANTYATKTELTTLNTTLVNAIAQEIKTLSATVDNNISSSINSISESFANTTNALAGSITTLTSTVNTALGSINTLSTSVTTLANTVDGVKGSYGIAIDNNGHITGFSLVSTLAEDSSNATSEFTISADKFNVVNPNNTGDTITPFAVITSGEDAGVYVNGAVIKPGSIAANRIIANELSAINANMGTITAGVMRNAAGTFEIDLTNGTITISA